MLNPQIFSTSFSHISEEASLGIRQSPRGLIEYFYLRAIGQTGTLELLVKEATAKSLQPLLYSFFIINIFKRTCSKEENLGRTENRNEENNIRKNHAVRTALQGLL